MANIKVKVRAACHVNKKLVEAGEIVELPEEIAASFGDPVKKEKPADDK